MVYSYHLLIGVIRVETAPRDQNVIHKLCCDDGCPIHSDSGKLSQGWGNFWLSPDNMDARRYTKSMNTIISFGSFAILSLLWLGFAAALVFNQSILDNIWQALRGMPIFVQVVVWLLVLPIAMGLWIWEMSWPLWIRLILIIGLGWATIYTFFPKQA